MSGAPITPGSEGPEADQRTANGERLQRPRVRGLARWSRRPHRWLGLLVMLRSGAAATAVALLAVHRVTSFDQALIVFVVAYGLVTAIAALLLPRLVSHPAVWLLDVVVLFVLICLSGDWRSPFYLLALTTLALPAAFLGTRLAVLFGGLYAAAFAVAAHFVGPDPLNLGTQASIETLATHLVLPPMTCLGIGYAAETLRGLHRQRLRAERLAIEAERRRIAWQLHDSAKQRVHAAHLMISSLTDPGDEQRTRIVGQALVELQAAAAEMDTSVAELREPLMGRPLHAALRARAAELTVPGGPQIAVEGALAGLPPLQAAHAYRVVVEALTNAVRHAAATHVVVSLDQRDGEARVLVRDDGRGLPETLRPGATGITAMRNRARSIDGQLTLSVGEDGTGTTVELVFPWVPDEGLL